ncbi:hypothetical protein V1478_013029 [Vespula squamosa]|uniref:Uncharacterized protein n=1 Tax=Vespula squamosa TaxID=30214 RepID=A0ABD2A9M4_VESSQ
MRLVYREHIISQAHHSERVNDALKTHIYLSVARFYFFPLNSQNFRTTSLATNLCEYPCTLAVLRIDKCTHNSNARIMRKSGLRQSTILVKQWDCGEKHTRIVATLEMPVGNEARTASGAPISYVLHFKIPSISEAVRQEAICESSTTGSTGKG